MSDDAARRARLITLLNARAAEAEPAQEAPLSAGHARACRGSNASISCSFCRLKTSAFKSITLR